MDNNQLFTEHNVYRDDLYCRGIYPAARSAKDVFVNYYDLIRNHIPVPKVKKTAQMLRERDVNMPSNVVEYEQFIDRLKIIMWRKQR